MDFPIHIPVPDPKKRHAIIRFNSNLNVDISQFQRRELRMKREDNRSHVQTTVAEQDYGAGSEYGRAAREEARRKKFGRLARTYQIDRQPWLLSITDPETAKEKKYRSIVDQTNEHADFWIFEKQGDVFNAYKVNEWYNFLPIAQHKILDIDQAEEQFQQRNRVLNQFALKAQIQQQVKDSEEDGGKTIASSLLKIKDNHSDEDDEDDDDEDGVASADKPLKKSKKRDGRDNKDKKVRVKSADEVAAYESDDGDDDMKEFDYMTDSGSESDRDEKTAEEKIDEALVAVGDETGLRKIIDDNESESDDEEDEDEDDKKNSASKASDGAAGDGKRESDDSEDDDPDSTTINSPLLLQKKDDRKRGLDSNGGRKTPPDSGSSGPSTKKIKLERISSSSALSNRANSPASPSPSGTTGRNGSPGGGDNAPTVMDLEADAHLIERVRHQLLRKPHTTKDLLNIMRPQFPGVSKQELVQKLADVLRKLEAKQERRTGGKKGLLYFSLDPKVGNK